MNNLQLRATDKDQKMKPSDIIQEFLKAIFYVGKGCNARPNDHLKEASTNKKSEKLKRINDILATKKPDSDELFGIGNKLEFKYLIRSHNLI